MIFSVIIPCYNGEKTILRALKSVLNQTYKNFEIIIVDDGSKDNSKFILLKYLKNRDVQYKYIYQENNGPSSARNKAVKSSKGKYLAFLDSDDEWHKEKLNIQYEQIKKFNAKFISCKYTLKKFRDIKEFNIKKYTFKDFLLSNRSSTPCTIVEKELFNSVGGFNENLSYSEDYNLWIKISRKEDLYLLSVPLVKLYKKPYGESGLSSDMWKMEKGELYNYNYCYKMGYINSLSYVFLNILSILKYIKRRIIRKLWFFD
ncbi:MAG: glycosyltransferase family 2 protein [Campylobacteraceae bacterium]|nr:glycosyltransferase family 2 protein [Campylobacteraceae bacterium]